MYFLNIKYIVSFIIYHLSFIIYYLLFIIYNFISTINVLVSWQYQQPFWLLIEALKIIVYKGK